MTSLKPDKTVRKGRDVSIASEKTQIHRKADFLAQTDTFVIISCKKELNSGSRQAERKGLATIIACGHSAVSLFPITNLPCLTLHFVPVWR